MYRSVKAIVRGLAATMTRRPCGAQDGVIAPGTTLEKLAGGFAFTEGPTCDRDGNVFFTDQPNDRILKWSVDGKLHVLHPAGRSNGMYFDPAAICSPARTRRPSCGRLRRMGRSRAGGRYEGKPLNGPNDVWCHGGRCALLHRPVLQAGVVDVRVAAAGRRARLLPAADRRTLMRVTTISRSPTASPARPTGRRCTCPTSAREERTGTRLRRTGPSPQTLVATWARTA